MLAHTQVNYASQPENFNSFRDAHMLMGCRTAVLFFYFFISTLQHQYHRIVIGHLSIDIVTQRAILIYEDLTTSFKNIQYLHDLMRQF